MSGVVNAIKNNYGKYLARTAGAVALGLVVRDAHVQGKIQADSFAKTKDADAAQYYMENMQNCSNPSITKNKLQRAVFDFEINHNIRGFFNSFRGYFQGSFKSMIFDAIPLALGSAALFAKNAVIAKGSAIGLAAYAFMSFLKDGLGIGNRKDIMK